MELTIKLTDKETDLIVSPNVSTFVDKFVRSYYCTKYRCGDYGELLQALHEFIAGEIVNGGLYCEVPYGSLDHGRAFYRAVLSEIDKLGIKQGMDE